MTDKWIIYGGGGGGGGYSAGRLFLQTSCKTWSLMNRSNFSSL